MQIIRLKTDDNKCLVDFDINFEIDRTQGSSTVLIGENGTGKSTMLQTVLEIMMSFESDAVEKNIDYQYLIEYYYKGSTIIIQQSEKYYKITINGEFFCEGKMKTVKAKLALENRSIIPERINYFYSGLNDHALINMRKVDRYYVNKCRKVIYDYWNSLYLANHTLDSSFPKRRFTHCADKLVTVYLIALLCGNDSIGKDRLYEQCHISNIDTVSLIISIDKLKRIQNDLLETVQEGLYDLIAFIDDRFTDLFRRGFLYQDDLDFVFELRGIEQVDADTVDFYNFFEKLYSIFDAEFGATIEVGNAPVFSYNLSEGQRQLIKILGMLCICKDEDTLVLMDEPDAHMNPRWKYELKKSIDDCLAESVNTQALIATHDPLVINGVSKSFIRVFTHNTAIIENNGLYVTKVIEPTENTEGLGIDGLLQSEYYGLRTSYDKKTTDKFIRRQELYAKLINSEASEDEKTELRELTKEIGSLPVSYNSIDFLYDDFIRVFKNTDLFSKEYLSYDEIQRRREKIKEIIEALYEGEV